MAVGDVTRQSLWRVPGFVATLVAVAAAFGSWSLLLPVVPLAVISSGGSDALAGATTGVFMAATVVTQMFVPRALRLVGYTPVIVCAAVLLGIPAIVHAFTLAAVPLLLVSAIRGVGFGALTVAESALIAELVPARSLGKASGALGLVVGLAELIFLPIGVYIAEHVGYTVVYWSAAVVALLAAMMGLSIPRMKASPKMPVGAAVGAPTWKLVIIPALGIATVAIGFGAISTFLPAAIEQHSIADSALIAGVALSLVGGTQMVSRYAAGVFADRRGAPGKMMFPALMSSLIGMILIVATLTTTWSSWGFLLGAAFFGLGFGAVQNEALLLMFARMPREKISEASAIWNMSFDSGTGVGSLALGVVALSFAYQGVFAVGAACIAAGAVAYVFDWFVGKLRGR